MCFDGARREEVCWRRKRGRVGFSCPESDKKSYLSPFPDQRAGEKSGACTRWNGTPSAVLPSTITRNPSGPGVKRDTYELSVSPAESVSGALLRSAALTREAC